MSEKAAGRHGARVYLLPSGTILVKQTVRREARPGEGKATRYVVDGQRERHVAPDNDAALAQAVKEAINGRL